MFIRELKQLKQGALAKWLILGGFNLILRAQDKSNGRINRAMMARFRKALDHLEVKEIDLMGRKFTWSNNQASPTLSRIDRAFCSLAWERLYEKTILQALSSSTSDNSPIVISPLVTPRFSPKFKFESFWVHLLGFYEVVQEAWNRDSPHNLNHLITLHVKLGRVAKALRRWSKRESTWP
jgi:hypothetical protein